jgi:hypothetical protein
MKYLFLPLLFTLCACEVSDILGKLELNYNNQTWSAEILSGRKENNKLVVAGTNPNAQLVLVLPDSIGTFSLNPESAEPLPNSFLFITDTTNIETTFVGFNGTLSLSRRTASRADGSFQISAANALLDTINFSGQFINLIIP